VELIDGDVPASPPSLGGTEAEVFAELLAEYSRQLRGAPRERIVAFFESSGMFDEQVRRLSHRRASHRAGAAFLLGDIGSPAAATHLVPLLQDRSRDVRAAASRSLGRVQALEAIEPLVAAGVDGTVPLDVSNLALLDLGPTAIGRLVELVDHPDSSIRASAVQLIGLLGGAADVDPILDHLSDPAAAVRSASAATLGRLGASEARDALIGALDDRVPDVRTAAAEALGQIGGRHAVDALVPVARSDAFEPARAAAEALARIDPMMVRRIGDEPEAGPHLREAADRVSM
jgi:HEAT repeat protein